MMDFIRIEAIMTLAINSSVQVKVTQGTTAPANLQSVRPTTDSSSVISPLPTVRVNESATIDDPVLESPYINITNQAADSDNLESQNYSSPSPVDKSSQQILGLSQKQQDIHSRQDQLETQKQDINQEMNQLQQKELEINRKKFQLQQQSTGNLLNISV